MKYFWTGILTIIPFLSIFADANRLGFQASAAYSDFFGGNLVNNHGGVALDVGGIYEWQYNHLLLQTGVNLEYSYNTVTNKQYLGSFPNMIDTDNDVCSYHYSLDNKRDQINFINVTPHITIGGQWNVLYFLVGLRGHLNIFNSVSSEGVLTTTGEYENLIIPLQHMNNHYFIDSYPLTYHNKNLQGYKGNISLLGEVGIKIPNYRYERILSSHTIQRLAVYVEYGFLSFGNKQIDSPLIDFHLQSNKLSDLDFEKITIQPLYFSNMLSFNALNRISIGVRWTMLFELPQKIGCKCNGYL